LILCWWRLVTVKGRTSYRINQSWNKTKIAIKETGVPYYLSANQTNSP
jgi:alkylated DNA nucleotide flippase Atl1